MSTTDTRAASTPRRWVAVRTGLAAGVVTLGLYLLAGIVVADWNVREFVARLSPSIVAWLVLVGGVAITVVSVPVVVYLRFRVVSPLVVLCVAIVGWTALGIGQGIAPVAFFGLAYYAFAMSPVYLLCYLVFGAVEYRLRD